MSICYTSSRFRSGDSLQQMQHQITCKGQDQENNNGSDNIEEQMNQSCSLRIFISIQRRQQCGHTGTDITSQNDLDADRKLHQALLCHQKKNTDGYRRTLNNGRDDRTKEYPQERIGQAA